MTQSNNHLFKVENLQKYFPIKKKSIFQKEQHYVKANKDLSMEIFKGETLGLVGESGCGKSTFGRTLIQLYEPTGGSALFYGIEIEEIMPSYVKKAYNSIPKVFPSYEKDSKEFFAYEEAYLASSDENRQAKLDEYTTKRHSFNQKYKNLLRLAGGTLAHKDLNKVSKVLLELYEKQSVYAKILKEKGFVELKSEVDLLDTENKKYKGELDALDKKLEAARAQVAKVEERVEALRTEASSNPSFDLYEAEVDHGVDLASLTEEEMRSLRRDIQIIFQDPYGSLDPRFTVGNIIGEGLIAHGIFKDNKSKEYTEYIIDIMKKCGLEPEYIHRYPHQFSGGQRQRIGIARALAMKPKFIVCDEAVSALDVSIQAQVLELLEDLKEENNLTYLFITHDLGVVKYISDRIGVMYFGHLVEIAPASQIFANPQHPYTKELLNAIPRTNESRLLQEKLNAYHAEKRGDVDYDKIFDFGFHDTRVVDQDWYEVSPGHFVACRLKEGASE